MAEANRTALATVFTPAAQAVDPYDAARQFLRTLVNDVDPAQLPGFMQFIVQLVRQFMGEELGLGQGQQTEAAAAKSREQPTNLQRMRELQTQGADINALFRDENNRIKYEEGGGPSSPLSAAVRYGDRAGIDGLVAMGADVNANGGIAMWQAIFNKDFEMVKYLHEKHGANLAPENHVPIVMAISSGNTDVARYILDRADAKNRPGFADGFEGGGALVATTHKNVPMIRLLAEYGADMNARDGAALLKAVEQGDPASVRALIVAGADVNLRPEMLANAVNSGNPEILQAMIEGGADVSKINMDVIDGPLWEQHPEIREALYTRLTTPEDAGKPLLGASVLAEERALQGREQPAANDAERRTEITAKLPGLG
jgi:ankyrin repeat protein